MDQKEKVIMGTVGIGVEMNNIVVKCSARDHSYLGLLLGFETTVVEWTTAGL